MFQRRGRPPSRHLAANGQGPLGRPPAEARLRQASSDPERVSDAHWPRSPLPKPRARYDRLGEVTTRACGLTAAGAASYLDLLARARRGSRLRPAGWGVRTEYGQQGRPGNPSRAPTHNRATAPDAAPRRNVGPSNHARRAGRLRQDDSGAPMARQPSPRVVRSNHWLRRRGCARTQSRECSIDYVPHPQ